MMAGLYFDLADWMLIYGQGYGHLEADTEDPDDVVPDDQRQIRIWLGKPDIDDAVELAKLTTRGFSQVKETTEQSFADCANPNVLGVARTFITTKTASIEAEGLLEPERREGLQLAYDNDIPHTVSFQIGDAPPYGGYYTGLFVLVRFDILGEEASDSQRVQCALEWRADGNYQWIAAE